MGRSNWHSIRTTLKRGLAFFIHKEGYFLGYLLLGKEAHGHVKPQPRQKATDTVPVWIHLRTKP